MLLSITDMNSTTSRKITVAEMAPHIHSFMPGENKVAKLAEWLIAWIKHALKTKIVAPYDFLPSKGDLACHIGVSQGTMQNVFRLVEDAGYIESKQRIGTYIKDNSSENKLEKLTSKRELAIETVKKYIIDNDCKTGEDLPSARKLAQILNIPATTLMHAISSLSNTGILKKVNNNFVVTTRDFEFETIEVKTLVNKVAIEIRKYVNKNLKPGEKLPSNYELTQLFNVSIKTIHDSIKQLSREGLLYTRRGRYGTIVVGGETNMYHYERIGQKIRNYIIENCNIGDKLPSIRDLARMYDTSEKTVKTSLDELASDGYITFSRGRYGGTFVMDIPENSKEAYKWLAINSDYVQN